MNLTCFTAHLFALLLITTVLTSVNSVKKEESAQKQSSVLYNPEADDPASRRRSNFPCGKSFIPCENEEANAVAFGVRSFGDELTVEGGESIRLNGQELEPIAAFSSSSSTATKKTTILRELSKVVSDRTFKNTALEAKAYLDEIYNKTEPRLYHDFRATNFLFSTLAWHDLTKMDKFAKEMAYSALVSIRATQSLKGLSENQIQLGLPEMSVAGTALAEVCPVNLILNCIPGKYRTYSGHCNNVRQPLWGAAYEPMQRLQPPAYSDGISVPRELSNSVNGGPLPSPRIISRRLLNDTTETEHFCSLLLAQWGQFVYEDVARVGSNRLFQNDGRSSTIPLPCCAEEHPECMPILTDQDDQAYKSRGQCIPYARSFVAPRENCTLGIREQGNLVSSFLDGSHIYGCSKDEAAELRLFEDGLLKTNAQPSRQDLLPAEVGSKSCSSSSTLRPCFKTGSTMTNLLPTGAALHTIWVRHHNRIAKDLKKINSHWDDERLFQETRRVLIAQLQHITFNEWLPIVVGKGALRQSGLQLRRNSYDSDYNIRTNPGVLNEYASAVGPFFFALFPDTLAFVDKQGIFSHQRPLSNSFNDPSQLYQNGRLDDTLRFLLQHPILKWGPHVSKEFRERFLRGNEHFGVDLVAKLVQRGRDHGINGYPAWRQLCGLRRPRQFSDLADIFLPEVSLAEFEQVYAHVDDIDLLLGGLAEKPSYGSLLGPTFACIMTLQFERLRHGDRFWYENFFQPSAFTEAQLNELRQTSFAAILCDSTDDLGMIQPNVFQLPDNYMNCPVSCNNSLITRPDLRHWTDQEPRRQLPITRETLEKALRLGAEQYRRLEEAEAGRISRQRSTNAGDGPVTSALLAHASLMAPKRESLDIARTAGILRETTRVLLRGDGLSEKEKLPSELDLGTLQRLLPEIDVSRVISNFSAHLDSTQTAQTRNRRECLPKPLPCDHTAKYRSYSGWCNNLQFPNYGNAFEPLRRLLNPAYDDGFDTPRTKARQGRSLPSARRVSNVVHAELSPKFHVKFSHMVMQFGQIVDHDIAHSPIARGPSNSVLNCSRCDSFDSLSIHCFPIPIETGDPHFPQTHSDGTPRCMPFARSLLGQLTLGYRNQLNQLTAFLDASYIYGSTDCEANALRLFNRGRLNFTDLGYNRQALPQGIQERDCRSRPQHPCFNAGDERNNEQPGLTVLHIILLRQHNQIALALSNINNFWTDEELYLETRRIMVAKLQHVVYSEWLPVVLGCEVMARYDLAPRKTGYFTGYDATCDAAISQELATAALRFGHTLIRDVFPRMNQSFDHGWQGVDLALSFNNASTIYDEHNGHMESLLMGLLGAPGMDYDRHIVNAVRNHLFQKPGGPLTGLDLPAVNIQRARDHGIPGYNSYRPMCGLARANSFDDLTDTTDDSAITALKSAYVSVDDIDLFPGIMSERPMKGALVGPTLACILAEQFQRLKKCDRFYYENNDPATRFTPGQLAEIRKTTLSRIICESSEYARNIQPNSFLLPDELTNAPIKCSELPTTDLYEWLDRQFCVVDQRVIQRGKTKRITPCITCTCTTEGPECHSITIERCDDLFDEYLLSDIKRDTVCVIQCSREIRERNGQLRNGRN